MTTLTGHAVNITQELFHLLLNENDANGGTKVETTDQLEMTSQEILALRPTITPPAGRFRMTSQLFVDTNEKTGTRSSKMAKRKAQEQGVSTTSLPPLSPPPRQTSQQLDDVANLKQKTQRLDDVVNIKETQPSGNMDYEELELAHQPTISAPTGRLCTTPRLLVDTNEKTGPRRSKKAKRRAREQGVFTTSLPPLSPPPSPPPRRTSQQLADVANLKPKTQGLADFANIKETQP